MNKTLKIIISTAALINSITIFASAESYENSVKNPMKSPLGCKDVGYKYELNTLNILPESIGERQSLYFVYNKLSKPVNLFQMLKSSSTRNTFLNNTIRPNSWSVLATSEKELKYICTVNDNKEKFGKIIDCSKSLKICEYTRVKFGLNNRGNYWLGNGTTRGSAVGSVVRYGIIPR